MSSDILPQKNDLNVTFYFHCKSFTYKNLFESAFAMMIFMTQTNTGTMVKRVPEEQILT